MKRKLYGIIIALMLVLSIMSAVACAEKSTEYTLKFTVGEDVHVTLTTDDISSITLPNDPEEVGYTFEGWYIDDTYETEFTIESIEDLLSSNNVVIYAKLSAIPYNITYNLDGGENSSENPNTYTIEDAITFAEPTKEGYIFIGWDISEIVLGSTGEITVTASWISADACSQYTVNHYQQNLLDDEYTLIDTEDCLGEINASVTPAVKEYTGFTSPVAQTVTVLADGALVVDYYYARNVYTVTFNGNGGTLVSGEETQQVKFEGSAVAPTYEKVGYTFDGWDVEFDNVTEDVVVTASWVQSGDADEYANYTVNHYQQNLADDEYTLIDDESFEGLIDATITPAVNEYTGFTSPVAQTVTVLADGSLVVEYYYDRNVYTVTFNGNGGTLVSGEETQQVKFEGSAVEPTYEKAGYTFDGWDVEFDNVTEDVVVTASWVQSGDADEFANYTVNHYQQNVLDDEYTIFSYYTYEGLVGSAIKPEVESYNGFTSPEPKTVIIAVGGLTVVEYYYDRNVYNVTFDLNGGTLVSGEATQQVKYNGSAIAPVIERAGYTFSSWDKTFNKVKGDLVITASWIINLDTAYTVNHYQQNVLDNEYTLIDTENLTDATEAIVTPAVKEYTGFISPVTQTATVLGDGSLVVEYYYDRNVYTVTFNGNGGTLVSGEETQQVKFGGSAVAPTYEKVGYTLDGWDVEFDNVTESITVNAIFTVNTDTAYTVKHYKQNGSEYTLADTENLTGTTGESVTPAVKEYAGFISPATQTLTILADGSLVVEYYYLDITLNIFTITFNGNGGTLVSGEEVQTVNYGQDAVAPVYEKVGYTLSGFDKAYTNVSGSITINAVWTANTDTPYKVEHYKQNIADNGYTLTETNNLLGTTDTTIAPAVMSYTGFTTPVTQTVTVLGDGSLVVEYYYDRNVYTVTFNGNGGTLVAGEETQQVKFGGSAVAPTYEKVGYTFSGFDKALTNVSESLTISATWEEITQVTYTVKHYQQNVANNSYTLFETETPTANIGDSVTPAIKSYTGFRSPALITDTVPSTGNLEIDYYYDRTTYTLKFNGNGGTLTSGSETQTVKYGATISFPSYTRNNCTFAGWLDDSGNTFKNNSSVVIEFNDGDTVNLTVLWTITNVNLSSRLFGIDISYYQAAIDFDDVANECAYVIIRAGNTSIGDGTTLNIDTSFEDFYAKAKARNIPVGVYWYSCANTYQKGVNEATYMINNCLKGKTFEYPIFMDVEDNLGSTYFSSSVSATTQGIKGFCETLEKAGYYPGIYANNNYFKNYIDCSAVSQWDFWIARYLDNDNPTEPAFPVSGYSYTMWQYSADGYAPSANIGGRTGLDANFCYVDYPTIIKLAGLNGFTAVEAPKKSNEEVAKEVLQGLWGNGDDRKNALTAAGYDPTVIQSIVNQLLTAGKYTVNHYKENSSGEYVLFETEELSGQVDTQVTPAVKSYSGYNAPATQTITLIEDITLVVDYYYTINNDFQPTTIETEITTAKQLAEKMYIVATEYDTLYVMGCFGAPLNLDPDRWINNGAYDNYNLPRADMIYEAADRGAFGFDCVNTIKALLWGWVGNTSKTYGGASYASNGVPDTNADGMISLCNDVSTDFSNIIVGEAVWLSGHIGIYIGNGLAVECTPAWDNDVQITACNRTISGYNTRTWTKHGKLPYVDYTGLTTSSYIFEETITKGTATKSNEEVAREVLNGVWGAGRIRTYQLYIAGYDPTAIQSIVNTLA